MSTDTITFPRPAWSRDWSRPQTTRGTAHFAVEDCGHGTACWIWQGALNGSGYGHVRYEGAVRRVHRVIYVETHGPVGPDLHLDHLCRNRACCNPDHLEPVTARLNILRGVGASARNAAVTHCPEGHAYAGDNLLVGGDGKRYCRACRIVRARAAYRAKRVGVAA